MKIKKGDTVKVVTGKDKGKSGKVIAVLRHEHKITVEGLNIYKKHVRPKRQGEKGEVVQVVRPIHVSNVMRLCTACHKAGRTGYRFQSGKKVSYCKKCQATI